MKHNHPPYLTGAGRNPHVEQMTDITGVEGMPEGRSRRQQPLPAQSVKNKAERQQGQSGQYAAYSYVANSFDNPGKVAKKQ